VICVDSSVWISLLRNEATGPVSLLQYYIQSRDDEVLVGDLILLEILQGARDTHHADRLERNLRLFQSASMLGEALAIRAAAHYRHLRSRGITIRKTIDLIIGTFCIAHGHTLLHDDRDFDPMADHLGLRVLRL
jgi:predicted nucleic acid-binding protein